tara:strand:+ start:269 stop:757 length:489 start_codon:yes stop_codon:yes gene_type:complete
MTRAWPLTPLLLLILSTVITGAGIWMYFRPVVSLTTLPDRSGTSAMPVALSEEPEPVAILPRGDSALSARDILARSPFSPTRAAFSRAAPARPAPTAPQYRPEFVGLLGKGEKVRAMVTWNPGETAKVHAIGDETPWGILASATSSELVFQGKDGEKTLKLF